MASPDARLRAYLDRLEPSLRKDVERALAKLKSRATVSTLLDIIASGDMFAVVKLTSGLSKDIQRATATFVKAVSAGARNASLAVPSLQLTNQEAQRVAATQAAKLVTGITNETRKAIRAIVASGFSEGLAPREIANLIKPLIGLTERQTRAVLNQRTRDRAKGLTAAQAQARAERYTARLLRQRAEMIARTEVIAASTEGQLALWEKAQAQGLLPSTVMKRWLVTPDDRLCPRCSALEGVKVPLGGVFTDGRTAVEGPPLHVQCRCTLVIAAEKSARRAA